MSTIGFATLSVIPSLRGMDSSMRSQVAGLGRDAGGQASKTFGDSMTRGVGASAGRLGGTLTKTLTPAAAAVGLLGKRMFHEWDAGFDAIRTGTGATGAELNALGSSMKAVGARVTQPLSEVGAVMADLNTRTGQTGQGLEALTKRTLDLARVQGEGPLVLSEKLTRAFGDWSIATEDQASAMDKLFRASQATGPPVSALADLVVRFGSPLRQLGFGFEQTAALVGKFEKEGVNTELVMGSLRIALGKMAKAGEKDLPSALAKAVESIKGAKTGGEAASKAFEIFGARAGADMAAAIREGRFDLGELFKTVSSGSETIQAASDDTIDLGDKFKMLKNRVTGALGPFGEIIGIVGGAAATIGPVLLGVSQLGIAFGVTGTAAAGAGTAAAGASAGFGSLLAAAAPIVLIGAAIVGLGFLIFKFRDQIGGALKAVGGFFADTFRGVVAGLQAAGGFIAGIARAIGGVLIGTWRAISGATAAVWGGIKAIIGGVVGAIRTVFASAFKIYKTIIVGAWNAIRTVTGAVWGAIKTVIVTPINFIRNTISKVIGFIGKVWSLGWGNMKRVVSGVWNGIVSVVRGAINFVISVVEKGINFFLAPFRRLSTLPVIGAAIPDIPEIKIPRLAQGGTVFGEGFAVVGEKGPELLQLPVGAEVRPLPPMTRGGHDGASARAGDTFNIEINNPEPEPASTSLPAAMRRAQLIRGK